MTKGFKINPNLYDMQIPIKEPDLHVDVIQPRRDDDILESLNKADREIERLTEINQKTSEISQYKKCNHNRQSKL